MLNWHQIQQTLDEVSYLDNARISGLYVSITFKNQIEKEKIFWNFSWNYL